MKPKSRWPDAHIALLKLYEERVPRGMSQTEFGALYGIGTQGMVWQYLNGHRPLNIEAASRFARGLRCTIADISPDMAAALEAEILPVVGKAPKDALRRALAKVMTVLALATPPFVPNETQAAFNITLSEYTLRLKRWLTRFCNGFEVS